MTTLYLLRLNLPILEQLKIEEALLRADRRNFCLINEKTSPAIVMGISGKVEEAVNLSLFEKKPLPLLKRFSGGGTVVVDENSFFVTFILYKDFFPLPHYPERVVAENGKFFQEAFALKDFYWKERDYVLKEKKCGGNAFYLQKERFLQHSSFLWDFEEEMMDLLQLPLKMPAYRQGRSHQDFLCRLSEFFPSKEMLFERILATLSKNFPIQEISLQEIESILQKPHRKATIDLSAEIFCNKNGFVA